LPNCTQRSCTNALKCYDTLKNLWVKLILSSGLAGQAAEAKHLGCYYGVWAYTRPGMGEFWPEDIDVSICDVIYYGFGTILNDTFDVCSWDPWFDMGPPDFGDTTIRNCIQVRMVKGSG
jgi:hypothetical protein